MMTPNETAIVAAARACVGVRFRPQGRSIETGLDCVGLAAITFDLPSAPSGYALRGGDSDRIAAAIDSTGLVRAADPQRPADLLLARTGPHQFHLAILSDRGFFHADAALRRVTEVPGPPPWLILGRWRKG